MPSFILFTSFLAVKGHKIPKNHCRPDIIAQHLLKCKCFFLFFLIFSECPVAVTENGNDLAVSAGGVDVHGIAADHKVLVDHGIVDAQSAALFQGLVVMILDGIGKAHAHSQVASGVLIEQRVVEQQAALADGAGLRHQGALAQIGSAFVHGQHGLQQLFTYFSAGLHDLAVFKTHKEVLNKLAIITQGLGGVDDTLGLALHGRDEALLGGDVGVEGDALLADFLAAAELRLRDHAYSQVGAIVGGVMQGHDTQAVEVSAAIMQVGIMLFPSLDGVLIHARGA